MPKRLELVYKLKPGVDFWKLIPALRQRAEKEIKKRLAICYQGIADQLLIIPEARQELCEWVGLPIGTDITAQHVSLYVHEKYREEIIHESDIRFNLDVSIGVKEYEGALYLLPYCGKRLSGVLDFLEHNKNLEAAGYYIRTKGLEIRYPTQEGYRELVWKQLGCKGDAKDMLVFNIVTVENFPSVQPDFELELTCVERTNTLN